MRPVRQSQSLTTYHLTAWLGLIATLLLFMGPLVNSLVSYHIPPIPGLPALQAPIAAPISLVSAPRSVANARHEHHSDESDDADTGAHHNVGAMGFAECGYCTLLAQSPLKLGQAPPRLFSVEALKGKVWRPDESERLYVALSLHAPVRAPPFWLRFRPA